MIRGRYSCLVEMEIEISENTPNLLPFAYIKRIVEQKMTPAVKGMLDTFTVYTLSIILRHLPYIGPTLKKGTS